MEKREKIIVIAAGLAVLYGGLDYFVLSHKGGKQEAVTSDNASGMMKLVTTQLESETVDDTTLNIIGRINTPWPDDIFFKAQSHTLFDDEEDESRIKNIEDHFKNENFQYTGYLEMGTSKIAIINGTDYTVGDNIKGTVLESISSQHITLTFEGQQFSIDINPSPDAIDTQDEQI